MKSKKILVVVENIDADTSSGAKANLTLIQNLKASGFELKVLHYTRKPISIHGIDCIGINENKLSAFYIIGKTEKVISRLTGIKFNNFIERTIGFSFTYLNDAKSISKAIKKEIHFNADIVLTLSQGASFRPHYAMLSCSTLHNKWLAYIHDPYPFHLYPRPYQYVQLGFLKKEQFFERMSKVAKWFAFPSDLLKEWMAYPFPPFMERGITIPHQISITPPEKIDTTPYLNAHKFNLVHAGNITLARPPQAILKGFKLFLERNQQAKSDCELHLIGPSDYSEEALKTMSDNTPEIKYKLSNVNFNTAYWIQQNASVNLIIESKSSISPFLPGKFPHCIVSGKPILLLSPYYSETRRLLGKDYPYWSEVDDVEKIATLFEKLYENRNNNNNFFPLNLEDYLGVPQIKSSINQLS